MSCQLDYLRRCIPGRIRRALKELPETLDETYACTLEEIDKQNWEYAHRLFQCVAAASRPLRVNELAEFLAFDFVSGSTPTFLAGWRPEDPAHTVLSICSSLLAVVKLDSGSSVVQFAHFSVKEYLTSARLSKANNTISRFHVSMTAAHIIVAQACLGVLLHLDEKVTKDSLENFPLAQYAAEHWVDHARFENVSSSLQDGMKRLFDPNKSHLSVWTWMYDPEMVDTRRYDFFQPPEKPRATHLHYAALCGIHDVVEFLIVERSQDVSALGFDGSETPLHSASRCGHADVVQQLLEHGAFTEAQDVYEKTPLLWASERGYVDVVRILLEHGADTQARSGFGWTSLDFASLQGRVEVARVLLEHGADVKAQDLFEKTALYRAQEEVARLLLKHGADANALDKDGQTPLHWISLDGRVGTARVLLEHGVDVNARDATNMTPLHLASSTGKIEVVRLLLQYGADIHARDDKDQTPFAIATAEEHHEIIQILLEYGAGEDHKT